MFSRTFPLSALFVVSALLAMACSSSGGEAQQSFLRNCSVVLSYQAPEGSPPSYVLARGDFPGGDDGVRLRDDDGDGWYEARISPPPGRYRYYIFSDDRRYLDPRNVLTVLDENDEEYSLAVAADCSRPAFRVLEHNLDGGHLTLRVAVDRATGGAPIDPATLSASTNTGVNLAVRRESETGYLFIEGSDIPTGKHTLTISGSDTAGGPWRRIRAFSSGWKKPPSTGGTRLSIR